MASADIPESCLIDTTFIIHLVNPKGEFHAHALSYFQALQGNRTRLYLPTLVMAEYAVKGGAEGVSNILGTLNAQVCGFDMAAALRYGELAGKHPTIFKVATPDKERSVVDLMLVAIAETLNLASIITTDKNICGQFLRGTQVQALDIKNPIEHRSPLWRASQDS